jgi:hypothetical protein
MRLAGAATMLVLGGFIIVMFRREKAGEPHGSQKETGRA